MGPWENGFHLLPQEKGLSVAPLGTVVFLSIAWVALSPQLNAL